MTPIDKQELWNAILKLNNKPYIGSGYGAYNNVKNPALRGGLYNWKYRDMRDLYEQLVKYCELGEYEACWRVLLGYKTKIYPAYLRKIYQTLNCVPPVPCPAIGDIWHGGVVFFIDGNDYYVVSQSDYLSFGAPACNNDGAMGTNPDVQSSYQNTLTLSASPCGPTVPYYDILLFDDGFYSDWFTPSSEALERIVTSLGISFLTRFEDYWSSTEFDPFSMVTVDYQGSVSSTLRTSSGPSVRPIRKETCI